MTNFKKYSIVALIVFIVFVTLFLVLGNSRSGVECIKATKDMTIREAERIYEKCKQQELEYKSQREELEKQQKEVSQLASGIRSVQATYPFGEVPQQERKLTEPQLTKNLSLIK